MPRSGTLFLYYVSFQDTKYELTRNPGRRVEVPMPSIQSGKKAIYGWDGNGDKSNTKEVKLNQR